MKDTDYIIVATSNRGKNGSFHFWTGRMFSGDLSRAKLYKEYADAGYTIWLGVLDRKIKKVMRKFDGLFVMPKKFIEADLDPECFGKKDVKL